MCWLTVLFYCHGYAFLCHAPSSFIVSTAFRHTGHTPVRVPVLHMIIHQQMASPIDSTGLRHSVRFFYDDQSHLGIWCYISMLLRRVLVPLRLNWTLAMCPIMGRHHLGDSINQDLVFAEWIENFPFNCRKIAAALAAICFRLVERFADRGVCSAAERIPDYLGHPSKIQ